jgi:hypothetical protein
MNNFSIFTTDRMTQGGGSGTRLREPGHGIGAAARITDGLEATVF